VSRIEVIGDATLYLGDADELRESLPKTAALIGDPPYGQGYKVNTYYANGTRESAVVQRNGKILKLLPTVHEEIEGDDVPFDPWPWLEHSPTVVLWGAHKFADRLPAGGWFVWDKVPTGKVRDQGDGEAAWINRDQPMRIFRLLWDGLCVGEGARHEVTAGQKRHHPMQKPEMLMRWCIEQAGTPASITDPWMGSGSTGVAALQMGLSFVGCEKVQYYFDIACRRIEQAYKQRPLFDAEPARAPEQLGLEA
jgi:site-specific DNA-methyltransferase (adenine-specific)